jgi:hypothetical protein
MKKFEIIAIRISKSILTASTELSLALITLLQISQALFSLYKGSYGPNKQSRNLLKHSEGLLRVKPFAMLYTFKHLDGLDSTIDIMFKHSHVLYKHSHSLYKHSHSLYKHSQLSKRPLAVSTIILKTLCCGSRSYFQIVPDPDLTLLTRPTK